MFALFIFSLACFLQYLSLAICYIGIIPYILWIG